MRIDARLPLRFGPLASRALSDAVVTDGHEVIAEPAARFTSDGVASCACCAPRSGAAVALAALFRQRATSTEAPFTSVLAVVDAQGRSSVLAALQSDPLIIARYRFEE